MVQAKKSINSLTPYVDGNHSEFLIKNHSRFLKLDSNEPTTLPSPQVIQAIINYLQNGPVNWYPDVKSAALCRALSQYTQLPVDHILTFNGSDSALECIARTFLDKGDEVILFQPTYDHFRVYAESCDAIRVCVNEAFPGSLTEKILSANTTQLKLVYLVNPNNPTGYFTPQQEIEAALNAFPHVLFLLDEAYYEFCGVSMTTLTQHHDNIIVTRSFSKAFGLAALRCGYLLAHPNTCKIISKIRVGKNVNALAQVAATAALEDIEFMKNTVRDVKEAKTWMVKQFEQKQIPVKDTQANFILFQVAEPDAVISFLETHNIFVRNRSMQPGLAGYIRLTIGNLLAMKRFWSVFETVPQEFVVNKSRLVSNS